MVSCVVNTRTMKNRKERQEEYTYGLTNIRLTFTNGGKVYSFFVEVDTTKHLSVQ